MSPKERILSALSGLETDRMAWSPFLAYWWEDQSTELQAQGQLCFLEEIKADPLLRGSHVLFDKQINNCEISTKVSGNDKFTIYETAVGDLCAKHTYVSQGNTWFLTEHPVKTEEDIKILLYIYENTSLSSSMDKFIQDNKEIGDRGLLVPLIGIEGKSSFQSLIEYWVGTEELVYMLTDYPKTVEDCLAVMTERSLESVAISVDSPAEAFIFWEDSSTTNISPSYFEKYASPEIKGYAKHVKSAEKKLIHHACGHLKGILTQMAATGIDCIESISPPPTGDIELWDAFKLLPDEICLIGGIEPTVFLNSGFDELRIYTENLINRVEGKRFILANSDSCPPGVSIEKFKLVSDIVRGFYESHL